jgi:negative elongation factor B
MLLSNILQENRGKQLILKVFREFFALKKCNAKHFGKDLKCLKSKLEAQSCALGFGRCPPKWREIYILKKNSKNKGFATLGPRKKCNSFVAYSVVYIMAGFDEAGLSGSEYVRDSLGNCNESTLAMFLESFQQDNGILLPSLQQALPLSDLHNIPRYEFHHTVMENLREKLMSRFDIIGNDKLLLLLEQAFSFINVPALRPVVMDMLKRITAVPPKFIEMLAKEPELYKSCSLEVKRQIWIHDQPLFGDAVGPLLNEYLKDKNTVIFDTEDLTNQDFLSMRPKVRRQHSVVQQLSQMIGKSLQLYNLVLQFLRTLFLRTKEAHYCTLRAELLMAIHDLDVKEIKDVDPCHKFIWCLDACVRSQLIDANKIKDLKGYMKAAKATEEQVLG